MAGISDKEEIRQKTWSSLRNPEASATWAPPLPRATAGSPGRQDPAALIAGNPNASFYSISGSEFVKKRRGVGASRVRDMFEQAKRTAPSLIFIDEIDAVGRQRGYGMGGGNDEREQTLNALLVEMDGFENNSNVIVIAGALKSRGHPGPGAALVRAVLTGGLAAEPSGRPGARTNPPGARQKGENGSRSRFCAHCPRHGRLLRSRSWPT